MMATFSKMNFTLIRMALDLPIPTIVSRMMVILGINYIYTQYCRHDKCPILNYIKPALSATCPL